MSCRLLHGCRTTDLTTKVRHLVFSRIHASVPRPPTPFTELSLHDQGCPSFPSLALRKARPSKLSRTISSLWASISSMSPNSQVSCQKDSKHQRFGGNSQFTLTIAPRIHSARGVDRNRVQLALRAGVSLAYGFNASTVIPV